MSEAKHFIMPLQQVPLAAHQHHLLRMPLHCLWLPLLALHQHNINVIRFSYIMASECLSNLRLLEQPLAQSFWPSELQALRSLLLLAKFLIVNLVNSIDDSCCTWLMVYMVQELRTLAAVVVVPHHDFCDLLSRWHLFFRADFVIQGAGVGWLSSCGTVIEGAGVAQTVGGLYRGSSGAQESNTERGNATPAPALNCLQYPPP